METGLEICTSVSTKETKQKRGPRLMKGMQTRKDCQKSAQNTIVVDLAQCKLTSH